MLTFNAMPIVLGVIALIGLYLLRCVRVLDEYQRGVIFRLGRVLTRSKGPGLILVFWPVDYLVRVELRTVTKVIEPQNIITRDNVSVRVDAVMNFRVVDPMRTCAARSIKQNSTISSRSGTR